MSDKAPELLEDLRYLSPPPPEGEALGGWLWLAIVGSSVVVVLAVTWLFWRQRRRGKHGVLSFTEGPSPQAKALSSLAELEKLLVAEQQRVFTQRVSDIVRVYIEEQFGLRALHRSTEEFLFEAAQSGRLAQAADDLLHDFLTECDQIKFAKREVIVDAMRAMLERAREFVNAPLTEPAQPSVSSRPQGAVAQS